MALLPRRRSVLLKFLLFIPAIWFISVFLFADDGNGGGGGGAGFLIGHEKREKRNEPLAKQDPMDKGENSKLLQAKSENAVAAKEESEATETVKHSETIAKKKKAKEESVLDPDKPIYKHDLNQAGEGGKAVKINKENLTTEERKKYDVGWKTNAFNQYVSDMISVHRTVPSFVDRECKTETYSSDLPDTSIVVCFHNEAWSVLIRTIHSIVERTPDHLLREIILVDDNSDKSHLKKPLDKYLTRFPKVKLMRLPKREGLIRARLRGFEIAKGKTVTFLDSHCECAEGWLEPLLDRIKTDPKIVVCPVIDVIDDDTFQYHYTKAYFTNVGGFDWSLTFTWHSIPARERKIRKRATDPVPSPTMAGGLFTIDRNYFEYLGTYDPGFDIWGGENLELSFKVWMCGGRLEILPCSHVGHVFRKRSPYKWRTGVNVIKRNAVRLAEVWLDDYKKYYYERISWKIGEYGNVTDRIALRKKLNCTSFDWFIKNVYPELFIPGNAVASGDLKNLAIHGRMCLDGSVTKRNHNKPVNIYPCHGQGGNQYWMLSRTGEIRRDEGCLDYAGRNVTIFACHSMKGNQEWTYDHQKHQVKHTITKRCLEMKSDAKNLEMNACDPTNLYQQWVFKKYDDEKARNSTTAASKR